MVRFLVFLSSCLLIMISSYSQKHDERLLFNIRKLTADFNGEVALYIKNLKTGKTTVINADSLFSTASLVKVPILIGVMDKINRGELAYHQELVYNDSLLYPGVDILGSFKNGEKIELSKLMMLMMTMSDNTASRWLQVLAGTGTRINFLMDSLGFEHTRVNSKTPGRENLWEKYGWGQTTPREMATILEKIYKRLIISPGASERIMRCMNRNYWDEAGLSQIPPAATVFSKNGALNAYRSEAVLVRGYSSEYVYCIITNNIRDTSWKHDNEAWTLIRKVSNEIWNYYEPSHSYRPPADAAKFH
jgi:beta-lactamase class A